MHAAAFIVAKEKSVWQPIQVLDWLGLKRDAKADTISVTDRRISKALELLNTATSTRNMCARQLTGIGGSIISTRDVFGRIVRIMTRHFQITVAAAADWDTKHALDDNCLSEIQFWFQNMLQSNRTQQDCLFAPSSSHACAALIMGGDELVCHKMFAQEDANCSSTHRELVTILYSLEAFGKNLFDSRITWFTDNQAIAIIVEVGSMKLNLQSLAYKLFSYFLAHDIDPYIEWIPRA